MSTADRIQPAPHDPSILPASQPRPRGRRVLTRVVVALVVVGAGFGWSAYQGHRDAAGAPVAGECFSLSEDGQDVQKADCSSSEATWRVTSRVDGTHDSEQACAKDPEAVAGYEYERQSRSVDVATFVLCVVPVSPA